MAGFKLNLWFKLCLLSVILSYTSVSTIETPEPSSLLRPRDINPHPYGNAYDGVSIFDKNLVINSEKFMDNLLNQAPIQFPRITNSAAMNALPHPYEKFALKERLAKTERFSGADNQIVKPAYRALAKHAARVLNRQVGTSFADDEIDNYNEATNLKKHYAFSYTVKDSASGDDFSHSQQQHVDGAVKGSYNVQLPDGRMQIVKYIADNNGYRADVTYENEHNPNTINHVTAAPAVVQVPISVVPVSSPLESAQPIYNYYRRLQQRQQYVHQPAQIQQARPRQAIYYAQATPTQIPSPYYPTQLRVNDVKIHSYNTGPHANNLIRSTIAPSHRAYIAYQPASNIAYVSSTPNPAQIQSNTLARAGLIPVVVTTAQPAAYPIYRDINVTPPSIGPTVRRTTIYDNRGPVNYTPVAPVQSSQTAPDYDYVQIPASNHVYKRNTDKDSHVTTSSAQYQGKNKSSE
ncbi:uncharacterized protein LOC135705253 [Ochlerotatus camptorhynchus]|uniref:uncharacterized protein LOC135705253 n=1 Tax=Ochlerotatus camptorhynchus TaxID=644619 RepID=UPI0031DBBA6C